jgi:signal transduction histidine kinase
VDVLNFPIVALGAALISLIGVTLYALTQRSSIRSRDEQLVVARAQAYAMLELSQAGVLFLDREHKLMGEASAAAPELLGHTCGTGTAFVQVIADLVPIHTRRDTVAYLETLWKAEPTAVVDATQNPLQRVHSGSRHLAIRFSRLVVDGRVHHIIVSIEKIAAPRVIPHTIEVPALNEETFAKRLAGETGTRPALVLDAAQAEALNVIRADAASEPPAQVLSPPVLPAVVDRAAPDSLPPMTTGEFELGPMDITSDSLPASTGASDASHLATTVNSLAAAAPALDTRGAAAMMVTSPAPTSSAPTPASASASATEPSAPMTSELPTPPPASSGPTTPDSAGIIDPPDPRLQAVLDELLPVDPARLDLFLSDSRDKAGQLRAIMKLPAREPQAFREKLVLILEMIRGIHARAERLPLASINERAQRFEAALNQLRDKQNLSGNDFLPLAVKLDDLLSHLAIQGEVATRLREWRDKHGAPVSSPSIDATQRSATATGTTIRQPRIPVPAAMSKAESSLAGPAASTPESATQRAARLSDLSQESLQEMAAFLADMYAKRVSLVVVGLEDVPQTYRRIVEKILGQLIHNAIRHGVETPADRSALDKPDVGTIAVQFASAGADGLQLTVQDDGRGLDHDRIRAEAVRQGVLSAAEAVHVDPRKLSSLIFRPGFTTVPDGGARGIGMDVVRDLVHKAGGRVGIATKPGEYTRFRITLPHEKKNADAQVA